MASSWHSWWPFLFTNHICPSFLSLTQSYSLKTSALRYFRVSHRLLDGLQWQIPLDLNYWGERRNIRSGFSHYKWSKFVPVVHISEQSESKRSLQTKAFVRAGRSSIWKCFSFMGTELSSGGWGCTMYLGGKEAASTLLPLCAVLCWCVAPSLTGRVGSTPLRRKPPYRIVERIRKALRATQVPTNLHLK